MANQKTSTNRTRLLYSAFCLCILSIVIWYVSGYIPNAEASETLSEPPAPLAMMTYIGSGTGSIPDNDPAGSSVTFAVSGLPSGQKVTNVSLELSMVHTWLGDLTGVLSAPPAFGNSHIIFKEIGDSDGTAVWPLRKLLSSKISDEYFVPVSATISMSEKAALTRLRALRPLAMVSQFLSALPKKVLTKQVN